MATTFTITDGTTTVGLTSSGVSILEYVQSQEDAGDGKEVVTGYSVTEGMTLAFFGSTTSAVRTAIRGIENMLVAANRRTARATGPRVFITALMEGDAQSWRAEIFEGRLVTENIADDFWRGAVEGSLTFVRSRIWEGAEVEVSISANGQGAGTGGKTIGMDATTNWIQVDSAQVDGSFPGLARLRIQNQIGSSGTLTSYHHVYVGNNAFASPTTFQAYLQSDTALSGTQSGSNVTASVDTTPLRKFYWRFTSTQMAAAGRWFRVLANMASVTTPMIVQLAIYEYYGIGKLWQGGETLIAASGSAYVHDLGAVPIPPGAYSTDYAPVVLEMKVACATGTGTISLDWLALIGTDCFRTLQSVTTLLIPYNDYVEIDDIEYKFCSIESGARHPIFTPGGNSIVLFPGVTQRLHILTHRGSGAARAQLWYRPARLTV